MGQDFQRALAGGLKDGWLDALNDHKAKCSEEPVGGPQGIGGRWLF